MVNTKLNFLKKYAIILTARINLFTKNYDGSINQIKAALEKWPEEVDLLTNAQRIYRDTQNWDAYIKVNEKIEKMFSDNISFKLGFGKTLISLHRYEDALPRLKFCIENWNLGPSYFRNLANTYALLAICYGYRGNFDLLDTMLQEAEKLVSWDPDIAYGHLLLYKGTNGSEMMQSYLDEQIQHHPGFHAFYYWKALYVQYYLHDVQGSIKWYESALKKLNYMVLKKARWRNFFAPQQYAASWYILKQGIEACIQSNRPGDALRLIYGSKLRMLDGDTDVRVLTVYLDILKQSFDSAEKKCLSTLKKKLSMDTRVEYGLLLALAQAGQGKLDAGLSSIKQVLALDAERSEAWDILGSMQKMRNDWQYAIQAFQKLTNIDRFNFKSWENLGFCYVKIEDLPSAKFAYEQAVQLNSFEANTWIDLANIYAKLDSDKLALSAYQNGLKYAWLDDDKRQQALQAIDQLKSQ